MGFFNDYKAIGRINALIKQLEPKIDYIEHELDYSYSVNSIRLKNECSTVAVLMTEIMDILNKAGKTAALAPYYFHGKKCNIQDFSFYVMILIERAEQYFD